MAVMFFNNNYHNIDKKEEEKYIVKPGLCKHSVLEVQLTAV